MSETPGGVIHTSEDEQILHKLGYAQELYRSMGGFSNFAISFSIISILTGAVILYDYGLAWAGTASVGGSAQPIPDPGATMPILGQLKIKNAPPFDAGYIAFAHQGDHLIQPQRFRRCPTGWTSTVRQVVLIAPFEDLRGNYRAMAPDWTVPQHADLYTEEDQAVWRILAGRQSDLARRHACDEFLHGLHDTCPFGMVTTRP